MSAPDGSRDNDATLGQSLPVARARTWLCPEGQPYQGHRNLTRAPIGRSNVDRRTSDAITCNGAGRDTTHSTNLGRDNARRR
jgi:hypothetical protein